MTKRMTERERAARKRLMISMQRDFARPMTTKQRKQQDAWHAAWNRRDAAFRRHESKMRREWCATHPKDPPLPEHICALENPLPGRERWCAAALRWWLDWELAHPFEPRTPLPSLTA